MRNHPLTNVYLPVPLYLIKLPKSQFILLICNTTIDTSDSPNACISAAATIHLLTRRLKVPKSTPKIGESVPSAANALLGGVLGLHVFGPLS